MLLRRVLEMRRERYGLWKVRCVAAFKYRVAFGLGGGSTEVVCETEQMIWN